MKTVKITEPSMQYRLQMTAFLIQCGAKPLSDISFELPDEFPTGDYHGLTDAVMVKPSFPNYAGSHPLVCAWLNKYSGDFPFYVSLKSQLQSKGSLSEKQTDCVYRAIERDREYHAQAPKQAQQSSQSLVPGTTIVLGKFTAGRIAEENNLTHPHHAFEIVAVKRETEKAYLVTARLSAQRTSRCGICGLKLTDPRSILAGIGPICAGRYNIAMTPNALNELRAKFTETREIEAWIPKSTIKERVLLK